MASASRYKQFLRLLESWPIDKTKSGRDLGEFLHKRVQTAFDKGAATSDIDAEACDKTLACLSRINTDLYKTTYACRTATTFSGEDLETLRKANSTETMELLKKDSKKKKWFK